MALPAALNDVREKSSESQLSSGDFTRFTFAAAAVRQRGNDCDQCVVPSAKLPNIGRGASSKIRFAEG